jgi:hypothetical protein
MYCLISYTNITFFLEFHFVVIIIIIIWCIFSKDLLNVVFFVVVNIIVLFCIKYMCFD